MIQKTMKSIAAEKVIVIIRGVYGQDLIKLAGAMCDVGLHLMEVTFDQNDPDHLAKTTASIAQLCDKFGDQMACGAGTVLTTQQAQEACKAGASYIISPNVNQAVIEKTKELGLISIPGAMTPSEILSAHDLGADFVKVFPAKQLGLDYFKDIRGPINHVNMIATAGINEENFADFLKAGYVAAGISGRLTDKALIQSQQWEELANRGRAFRNIAQTSV